MNTRKVITKKYWQSTRPGSMFRVILHAEWRRRRGKKPILTFQNETCPIKSLKKATFNFFLTTRANEEGRKLIANIPENLPPSQYAARILIAYTRDKYRKSQTPS